ncbi:MAG: hypothetical protein IKO56_03075 [Alphaproteobacteria bacterium]|nr:hypothetical protein [Alphaproteobacteria bacterium]
MLLGTRLIVKEEKSLERSRQARASAFQKDTAIIKEIFDASSNCKAAKACKILAEPENLRRLLVCDKGNNVACFYSLHALFIVLALRDINRKAFLNTMTDENINVLRELILVAKQRPLPNKESLNTILKTRTARKLVPATQEYISNQNMILSARLTTDVADWWEDATKQLEIWLNDIDNFKREKTSVSTENWWSLADLAQKLGCKNLNAFYMKKCELLKQKPLLAAEINSWFAAKGQKKLFNPDCFAEFKALWNSVTLPTREKKSLTKPRKPVKAVASKAERKPRKAIKATVVPVVEQPKETANAQKPVVKCGRKPRQVQEPAKTKNKELKTLTDFKAFKEFIDWLAEQNAEAQNDFNTKTVDYESKLDAIREIKDSEQRVELLQQITEANAAVIESEKTFNQIAAQFAKATKLFDDLKKAQAGLKEMMEDAQKQK